jgi:hypothetical protein
LQLNTHCKKTISHKKTISQRTKDSAAKSKLASPQCFSRAIAQAICAKNNTPELAQHPTWDTSELPEFTLEDILSLWLHSRQPTLTLKAYEAANKRVGDPLNKFYSFSQKSTLTIGSIRRVYREC